MRVLLPLCFLCVLRGRLMSARIILIEQPASLRDAIHFFFPFTLERCRKESTRRAQK